jgi:hypothetical protein
MLFKNETEKYIIFNIFIVKIVVINMQYQAIKYINIS